MANTVNNPMKVITGPETRWSYANVWEAKSINGGTPKFSVSLIIPKSDTVTIKKIQAAIEAAYKEGEAKLKGNGRSVPALSVLKTPLRDGDTERPDDEAYANAYFVNANSATAPGSVVLSFAANSALGEASVLTGTIDLTFTISGKTVVKQFAWTKSIWGSAGASAVVFSVYAPNGTVVQNQSGSLTLAVSAYSGTTEITTGAAFQWAKYTSGKWTDIIGATAATLTVSGADIVNIQSYRCTMTYGGKAYVDVITVEDKSDPYVSEMLSIGGFTVKNNIGGLIPYVIVRTNQKEVDPLLGSISETPPSAPASGTFWYKVDHAAKTVTLMKYSGSEWAAATEKQSLTYTWYKQDKEGKAVTFDKTGKVIYLSAEDIDSIATLQCDVSKG